MPRKQKVVEQQPEVIEPTVVETTIDETTIETTLPPEAPAPVLADEAAAAATTPDEVKEVKVKPKRKAQPKKIKVQEIEEVKEQIPNNIPEEEPTNQKKVKTLEQVKCDTCKKETSPKPKEETKAPEKPTLTNTYQERLQKALEKRSETMQKLASQIV